MEEEKKKRKRREPTAWHWVNGKKERLTYTPSGKLSKLGEFLRDNPGGFGVEILDMRAVMK